MARAPQVHIKHPSEIRNISISAAATLDDDELLTGTPTVTATPSGLTFASAQVNTGVLTINGASVAIGKAIRVRVSGGASGVKYACQATCTTDATPAQTLVIEFDLAVSDS